MSAEHRESKQECMLQTAGAIAQGSGSAVRAMSRGRYIDIKVSAVALYTEFNVPSAVVMYL